MGEAVDRPVIWGEAHRYQLGVALGERTFWALDEAGRAWAVEIGRTEILQARAALARRLPAGVLPHLRECGEMPGGRLSYLVTEWLPGYTLTTFLEEGRRLSPSELRGLGFDIGLALETLARHDVELTAIASDEIIYSVQQRRWRLLTPGRWQSVGEGPPDLGWLASAMLAAGGSVPGEEPPWASEDRRLWRLLQDALARPLGPRSWTRRVRRLRDVVRWLGAPVRG
jgi:hypothetical protein